MSVNWVPGLTVEEAEKQCILQALRFYRGNKSQTAQSLRISIRTLDNKLGKYEADSKALEARTESLRLKEQEIFKRMRGPDVEELQRLAAQDAGRRRQQPAGGWQPPAKGDVGDDTEGNSSPNTEQPADGVRMESANSFTEKPAVSLLERKEVQTVLPKQTSANGNSGRR